MTPPPKAIIFDIGGVVAGSPLLGIDKYEKLNGLPHDYINVGITQQGRQGAFQRFERNELDLYSFYDQFGKELSDVKQMNIWYKGFCQMRGMDVPALPQSLHVDGRELFGKMMQEAARTDSMIVEAIRRLRESRKFKVAALTNNFAPPTSVRSSSTSTSAPAPTLEEELAHLGLTDSFTGIKHMFDDYFESSVVGMRKPDTEFYQHALTALGVEPSETVFLDDIGHNLKAAQALGIKTIRVSITSSLPAIRQLEGIVRMKLIDEDVASKEEERVRNLQSGQSGQGGQGGKAML